MSDVEFLKEIEDRSKRCGVYLFLTWPEYERLRGLTHRHFEHPHPYLKCAALSPTVVREAVTDCITKAVAETLETSI